jgi:uncharacterized membrane protein
MFLQESAQVSRTHAQHGAPCHRGDTVTHTIQPSLVGEVERIHALDALRGIALLGILMVNMASFKGLNRCENP